jgi:hypothetical protein
MKFTTHFELHSQTTRLFESASIEALSGAQTGFSPSVMPYSKGLVHRRRFDSTSLEYNSDCTAARF